MNQPGRVGYFINPLCVLPSYLPLQLEKPSPIPWQYFAGYDSIDIPLASTTTPTNSCRDSSSPMISSSIIDVNSSNASTSNSSTKETSASRMESREPWTLVPLFNPNDIKLWESYYLRHNPKYRFVQVYRYTQSIRQSSANSIPDKGKKQLH